MDLWRISDRKPSEEVLTVAPNKKNGDPFVPE